MNASELHRKLIYKGYSDISAYLNNSVNRFIYKQMIELKQKYGVDSPTLTLFNEVYYLCVKVQTDPHPGEEVEKRYLKEEETWLGSHNAAVLVLSIVYGILKRKFKRTFNDEFFLEQISPLIEKEPLFEAANAVMDFMQKKNIYSPKEFNTITSSMDELPGSDTADERNLWRTITDNFSLMQIEWYITLFPSRNEQTDFLNCIMGAMPVEEKENCSQFIHQLRLDISAGNFLPNGNYFDNKVEGDDDETDYDFMFAAGLKQTMEEAYDDRAEQYKQERDTYKLRLEEQKKAHAVEMARMEGSYQAEIAELLAKLDQMPAKETAQQVAETPAVPSLTITEMAAYIKERFSKSGADEVCAMLYRLAAEHHFLDEEVMKLIDGIVPAILHRDMHYQYFELPNVQQFNNQPQSVINNQ